MFNKGQKTYSVINNKCPRCQEGDFFVNNRAFDLKNFSKMHENCPVCGLSFEQEPGYYFGAMYMSYAINVAVMVTIWVLYLLFADDKFSIWWVVLISIVAGLLIAPITFRWARLMWINMFIRYDKSVLETGKIK